MIFHHKKIDQMFQVIFDQNFQITYKLLFHRNTNASPHHLLNRKWFDAVVFETLHVDKYNQKNLYFKLNDYSPDVVMKMSVISLINNDWYAIDLTIIQDIQNIALTHFPDVGINYHWNRNITVLQLEDPKIEQLNMKIDNQIETLGNSINSADIFDLTFAFFFNKYYLKETDATFMFFGPGIPRDNTEYNNFHSYNMNKNFTMQITDSNTNPLFYNARWFVITDLDMYLKAAIQNGLGTYKLLRYPRCKFGMETINPTY